jgi:quercetin dioxygenase-like cupin family protein
MRILFLLATLYLTASYADAQSLPYAPTIKVTRVLQTSTDSLSHPLTYASTKKPEVTMLFVEIPPGAQTGWHIHPVQGYAYIISGRLAVESRYGTHIFQAGQGVVEPTGILHNGKNIGKEPVKLIVIFTGKRNEPVVLKRINQLPLK